jgi:hypothetical protein
MASSCIAKSAVFASAARPNKGGKAAAKPARSSKLWTPNAVGVDSPTIIVEGDAESKMKGLTAKRREVILDMEDFAANEVRFRSSRSRAPPRAPREPGPTRVTRAGRAARALFFRPRNPRVFSR